MAVGGTVGRKRLDPSERRAQLVAIGLLELQRRGELAPVDRIAEAAGISRGLLFHYFPTKRDYEVAVVGAAADLLLAVTEPDPSLPVLDRLRAGLSAYIDFVGQNPTLYTSLLRGAAGGDDELQAIFDATRAAIAERVVDALGPVERTPALRTSLRGWVGFVEESTLDWLRHQDIERDELISLQERALLGLVTPPASR